MKNNISNINPNIKMKLNRASKYLDEQTLSKGLVSGDRQALSAAITLLESSKETDRTYITNVISKTKIQNEAFVICITGPPGVGKSTFINTLCQEISKDNKKIGILATDPSSEISKGSILGDKTRMSSLISQDNIFIRPSPSHSQLGGINRSTVSVLDIFNIAAYDYILIETVGVGQSEFSAYHLSDLFLLLVAPGGGDELQGIKRGIIEMADFICINKYDGDYKTQAEITLKQYANSGRLIKNTRTDWETQYLLVSAEHKIGIEKLWHAIQDFERSRKESGKHYSDRQKNRRNILLQQADHVILEMIKNKIDIDSIIDQVSNSKSDQTTFSKSLQDLIIQIEKNI